MGKNLTELNYIINISNNIRIVKPFMAQNSTKTTSSQTQINSSNKLFSIAFLVVLAIGYLFISYSFFPSVLDQTTDAKEKQLQQAVENRKKNEDQRKVDRQAQLKTQDPSDLKFDGQTVAVTTNYGTLNVDMQYQAAPKAVESFVRLSSRGYFNKIDFHRIVKQANFEVIQGGDPTGTGSGGESSFGLPFEDEVYKVKPEFVTDAANPADPQGQPTQTISNEPVFTDPNLYGTLDKKSGTVVYKKGYLIMANSGANTNGSQFFVTLKDTTLPASYTIFGVIKSGDFGVLDKISSDVGVTAKAGGATAGQAGPTTDGKPDKELFISEAKVLK
jgi:cyclophilin family peptidyl-prolyl cis-trans isomerase